jgi:hypothetical protein
LGHRLEIDRVNRIGRMTYFGEVTDEELASVGKQTSSLIEAFTPKAAIIDFTQVERVRVSTRLVMTLAELRGQTPEGITTVIVAPGDLMYGLARMFEILKSDSHLRVVRKIEDAYSALGVADPNFGPSE